ncbi:MAG TPA: xanthine dehydrogenase family protein subunit M [Acidiphilium sp.]|nr:MAG: carbon monoxide dehydrogenase [Acidiphilium sp. 21-60-14]OYV89799.1 MAG: carbon monoxide dehydrogenase [Acidiphilium sp. 37-60-79]HQT88169.1 xanthine dehydrogenase family protein subunit M [Acidiphilium sp.]HQU24739.1 xanthine dehydrogenase family protein subunit M [Acidiphilium sp.]
MIPSPFEYHAPTALPDVIALLSQYGDEAKLLAGGHSLLPMMKLRFAAPGHLIDLRKVAELKGISVVGSQLHIGAMTTENELIFSKLVAEHLPLLAEVARQIADPQVRYKGTIGGDISHGDPGNDHPAVMMAMDATFVLTGANGERLVKATEFFHGMYDTALTPGEVMTQIRIPIPAAGTGSSYAKLKRKTGDYATAAAAVVIRLQAGLCTQARIALTNVGPTALFAGDAAASLIGKPIDDVTITQAANLAMAICEPAPDLRGDEAYKTAMAGQMVERALRLAVAHVK